MSLFQAVNLGLATVAVAAFLFEQNIGIFVALLGVGYNTYMGVEK